MAITYSEDGSRAIITALGSVPVYDHVAAAEQKRMPYRGGAYAIADFNPRGAHSGGGTPLAGEENMWLHNQFSPVYDRLEEPLKRVMAVIHDAKSKGKNPDLSLSGYTKELKRKLDEPVQQFEEAVEKEFWTVMERVTFAEKLHKHALFPEQPEDKYEMLAQRLENIEIRNEIRSLPKGRERVKALMRLAEAGQLDVLAAVKKSFLPLLPDGGIGEVERAYFSMHPWLPAMLRDAKELLGKLGGRLDYIVGFVHQALVEIPEYPCDTSVRYGYTMRVSSILKQGADTWSSKEEAQG